MFSGPLHHPHTNTKMTRYQATELCTRLGGRVVNIFNKQVDLYISDENNNNNTNNTVKMSNKHRKIISSNTNNTGSGNNTNNNSIECWNVKQWYDFIELYE